MIRTWLEELVKKGVDTETGVLEAQRMARQAYRQASSMERELDAEFGGAAFRTTVVEPLIKKERQLNALRARLRRGGCARTTDSKGLLSQLERSQREYELLRCNCALNTTTQERVDKVESYIECRRKQLYLGDAEAVRWVLKNYEKDDGYRLGRAC